MSQAIRRARMCASATAHFPAMLAMFAMRYGDFHLAADWWIVVAGRDPDNMRTYLQAANLCRLRAMGGF